MNFPAIPQTQFQPYNQLEQANMQQGLQEQSQLGQLKIDTAKQEMTTKNALAPYAIQEAGEKADLDQSSYENQMLANVAERAKAADPADAPKVWDDGMNALVQKGIKPAGQYVGHFRPDLATHVYDTFTTGKDQDQTAAAAAPGGMDADAVNRAIAQMPPQQVNKSLANLNQAITGYSRIRTAADLKAEVQMLQQGGMDVSGLLGGINLDDDSPAGFASNYQTVSQIIKKAAWYRDQLANRATGLSLGINAQPKPLYEPQIQYIGTDRTTGQAQGFDTHTGAPLTISKGAIAPKPSAGMSTFQMKQSAWLSVHPNDTAGALEFANGKRRMDPGQIQGEAIKLANQQLADETLAGTTITNPDRWVAQRAAQIAQQISGAGAAPGVVPGGKGASGASRPSMSKVDVQASIANARAALKNHPDKRAVIIARLKAAGVPTNGL